MGAGTNGRQPKLTKQQAMPNDGIVRNDWCKYVNAKAGSTSIRNPAHPSNLSETLNPDADAESGLFRV